MIVVEAWSSEDGLVVAYKISDWGVSHILVNDNGDVFTIHGQGIDLDKNWEKAMDKNPIYRELQKIKLWGKDEIVLVKTVQNGKERVLRCTCCETLVNRGGNTHGVEQLLLATHLDIFVANKHVEYRHLSEHAPYILRNERELIGLVQGSILKADVGTILEVL